MDRSEILAQSLHQLRSLSRSKDGATSESYKNATKMRLTYDPTYQGLAIIDAKTGVGRVGVKFFGRIAASDELTAAQTSVFITWSDERRRLFVLRHELEHMSASNQRLVSHYRMGNVAVENLPRHKLTFEVDATEKAFAWMVSL